MDDEAIQRAMLAFGASLLIGPAIGGLVGWRKGFEWGTAIGALLIGIGGLYGAATLGWHRYQSIAGTESVQGNLVEFVDEVIRDKGRSSTVRAPIVEYTTPDGQKRRVKGLGGSASGKDWGDPVEVRYDVANPSQALVADFQNLWGGVWALGLFGGFPTLAGLFFLMVARNKGRPPAAPRSPTAAEQRWRSRGTVVANIVFLAGFAAAVFWPGDEIGRSLGVAFMTIGTGCLLHFVVQSFAPAMEFEFRVIFAIIGLVFVGFGYGAWKMM
jgi:hypothetical protein